MKLSALAKRMILVISVLSLLLIAAAAVYFRSFEVFNFALGVALTWILNVAKVILIERTTVKAGNLEETGKAYYQLQYLLRYLLTAAVLIISATLEFINFWGAAIGIFTFLIAAHSLKFMKFEEDTVADDESN